MQRQCSLFRIPEQSVERFVGFLSGVFGQFLSSTGLSDQAILRMLCDPYNRIRDCTLERVVTIVPNRVRSSFLTDEIRGLYSL